MAKDDATTTRLKNIEAELRSIATCTATTLAELQQLLSGDAAQAQKENIRANSARAPSAQSTARRRPANAQHGADSTALLSARQRYVLATQTANAALKSLADALKTPVTQRTSKPPPDPTASADIATTAQKPRAKSSAASHRPLKERTASVIANSPAKPKPLRRSSSPAPTRAWLRLPNAPGLHLHT
jgi:separase